MKTISVLENLPVFEDANDESTILTQVKEMDFFARMDETRRNGKTWSKIILPDGKMGWVESKKTFQWEAGKIPQRNMFCTSLEEDNFNEKELLSGSTIYIVSRKPKVLVRHRNNRLGQVPENFRIKNTLKYSPEVLAIMSGIFCVFILFIYSTLNGIDIWAKHSQPKFFMGLRPKFFMYGIIITGIVTVSSYYTSYTLGWLIGELGKLFNKLKNMIFREIKIRR